MLMVPVISKRSVRHCYYYFKKLNKVLSTNSASPLDVAHPDLALLSVGGHWSKPIGANMLRYLRNGGCNVGDDAECIPCQW